jgi:threonine synthase
MDVGDPSNFVRILKMFDNKNNDLKNSLSSVSITDEATAETLLKVFKQTNYLLDPHGAVAYTALQLYLTNNPTEKGIILETAHPVKFYDVIEPIINEQVTIPAAIAAQLKLEKKSFKV